MESVEYRKERKRAASVALALILTIIVTAVDGLHAADGDVLGFVSYVKGVVTLTRDGVKEKTLDGMNSVRAGDVIRVGTGSAAAVNLCGLSRKFDIKDEAAFTAGADGLKFSKGKSAGAAVIQKAPCEILMNSAAKFDRAAAMKEQVEESVGAMSLLSALSTGSGGGSSASIADVLGEIDKWEYDVSMDGAAGYSAASEQYTVAAKMPAGGFEDYGAVGELETEPAAEPPAEFSDEPIYEDRIAKPEAEYITGPIPEIVVFDRPAIALERDYDAVVYNVKIYNSLDIVIFETETDRPYFVYPDSEPPLLRGGWYMCEVIAKWADGMEVGYEYFGLSVSDTEAHERFEGEERALKEAAAAGGADAGVHILLGRLYESRGLTLKAAEAYRSALSLMPGNAALELQLSELDDILKK